MYYWDQMLQPAIRKMVSTLSHHCLVTFSTLTFSYNFRLLSNSTDGVFRCCLIVYFVTGSVKIVVHRVPSTTDTIRKHSEPRILSHADLRLALAVEKKESDTKIAARPGAGPVDYIPSADDREIDQDPANIDDKFEYSHGITSSEADKRFGIYGPNQLPEKIIPKVRILFPLPYR